MQSKKSPTIILIVLMALGLLVTACSPSAAEKYNKDGNDAYAQQAYEEALAAYQAAQIKEPELAQPYYNAANALYRQGAYDAALEQLQMALSFAEEEALAQSSFYNLGNSFYNAQDLETAVASYTESLLLNPDDQDAKYNLELALQQQQQEEQQQEQEQEQEQEQQEDQSQDGESQEEEQEQQDQSQEGEGQQDQQPGEEQSEEGQQGEQEQESEQSESDQPQDGEPQDGEQEQDGQPQPGQEDPNQEGQPSQVPAPGQRMTEEQAEQLLAAIAKDSETLQERLGQIFAVPWQDPVQDW
jgi:Ca-activated chloride channel family protein